MTAWTVTANLRKRIWTQNSLEMRRFDDSIYKRAKHNKLICFSNHKKQDIIINLCDPKVLGK